MTGASVANRLMARKTVKRALLVTILVEAFLTIPIPFLEARSRALASLPAECRPICFRGPRFFETRIDRLPRGVVAVAGINGGYPVSTFSGLPLRLAFNGSGGDYGDGSTRQRFNKFHVAAQLSLLALPGSDQGALASTLECFGLDFEPVRLGSGFTLSPASTLDELLDHSRMAARDAGAADQAVLANLLQLLTGDDLSGRCGEGGDLAFSPTKLRALEDTLTRIFEDHEVPGVIVYISVPGEGKWIATRGLSGVASGIPMTTDLHTRIGSVTKTFVTTAALRLADKPNPVLRLDDPVSKFLNFVPNGNNITVRQLGNMTSGLTSYSKHHPFIVELFANPNKVWTPRQLVDIGLGLPVQFLPGQGWDYSNTNLVLLGLVLESATGKSMQQVVAEEVLQPLGLLNTSWPNDGTLPVPFARGFTYQLDGSIADSTNWNPSWGSAAGALISNLEDLVVYTKALGTGSLLSPALQAERLKLVLLPPLTISRRYGFGIGFENGWLGHTGELPGYNTAVYYLPAKDATIVVIANSDVDGAGRGPAARLFFELGPVATPDYPPTAVVTHETDDLPNK